MPFPTLPKDAWMGAIVEAMHASKSKQCHMRMQAGHSQSSTPQLQRYGRRGKGRRGVAVQEDSSRYATDAKQVRNREHTQMILKEPETKILPASANNRRPRPGGYSDEQRQNSPASSITRNHTTRAQEKTHMEERRGDRWEEEEERREDVSSTATSPQEQRHTR